MDTSRFISHHTIQEGLFKGVLSVNYNILSHLKINRNSIILKDLIRLIYDDLKEMNFIIKKTDRLHDEEGNNVPGMIVLNTYDRKDGGTIFLNKNYPKPMILEALFHEYAHIKDDSLPILPMDKNVANYKALYNKSYLRFIEFQVDMIAFTLMMPPEKIWADLIEVAYDIDKILDKYKEFDKRSVLKWLSLIDSRFPCHFSCILLDKNHNNEIIQRNISDSYVYDHTNDPQPFDILAVLSNNDSAAATASCLKRPESVNKATNINGVEYYCFAYYETNLSRETMGDNIPGITSISYDRLLVIGWKKADYDLIQMYKQ